MSIKRERYIKYARISTVVTTALLLLGLPVAIFGAMFIDEDLRLPFAISYAVALLVAPWILSLKYAPVAHAIHVGATLIAVSTYAVHAHRFSTSQDQWMAEFCEGYREGIHSCELKPGYTSMSCTGNFEGVKIHFQVPEDEFEC